MNKLYLVLADSDFGRSLTLSRATDLMFAESEADAVATECIKDGQREVLLFELKRVYRPTVKEGERRVEECFVDPDGA